MGAHGWANGAETTRLDADQHNSILADLGPLLAQADQIVMSNYFGLSPTPSELLVTSEYSVLELTAFTLKQGRTFEQYCSIYEPNMANWESQGRRYAMSEAHGPPASEAHGQMCMWAVAWISIAEAKEARKDPAFQKVGAEASTLIKESNLFGHIFL